jgi:formylglycine-generating enzyme required for sulfatase activity
MNKQARNGARMSLLALLALVCACGEPSPPAVPSLMAEIPGGVYPLGSDAAERRLGYEMSPSFVRSARWYDEWEADPRTVAVEPFLIDRTPVTQEEYAEFVRATGHRAPWIDEAPYVDQGFLVHPYSAVRAFLWEDGTPDSSLLDHPVVLVDLDDANAYCEWRGARDGLELRLPTEEEWEATCRGSEGRTFPWGSGWLDEAVQIESKGTASVHAHPQGMTSRGVADLAGNVFEWTGSSMPNGRPALKGCSWDDAPGTCRCAFRHGRPRDSRHILIGFRCAASLGR